LYGEIERLKVELDWLEKSGVSLWPRSARGSSATRTWRWAGNAIWRGWHAPGSTGLERRDHLHPSRAWLCLPGRCHRLV